MKNRKAEWIAPALIVAMFAVTICDGSKLTGLVEVPIIALAIYALIGLAAIILPPLGERAMSALSWLRLVSVLLMAAVFGQIVLDARLTNINDARGPNIVVDYVIPALLALEIVAWANLMVLLTWNKSTKTLPPGDGIGI